jgi:nitroreductase
MRAVCVALCAVACLRAPASTQEPCVSESDPAVAVARLVVTAAPAVGTVWPGFWPAAQPFFLARPGIHVLLYSEGAAPARFRRVPLASGGDGAFFAACGEVPELSASRGFMDISVPLDEWIATAVPIRGEVRATLEFLYHEAFHAFQRVTFAPHRPLDAAIPDSLVAAPAFQALGAVERRILASALMAPPDSAAELARRFLAVRAHRLAAVPAHIERYEAELERIEGSAELVGRLAALVALGEPEEELVKRLRHDLLRAGAQPRLGGEWRIRFHAYATGAALAVLLDHLRLTWRGELEGGGSQVEILRRALASSATAPPPVPRVLEEYGYDALLREFATRPTGPGR